MATSDAFIGRREAVGLGIESVQGTGVAPQVWLRWLSNDLNPTVETLENESAMGRVERVNDSEIVSTGAEGTIGGKVTSEAIGYLLLGLYGSVNSVVDGDNYAHTFSVDQSSVPTTLSVTTQTPLQTKRHAYAVIDNLEVTAETGGWVEMSAAVRARAGEDASTETVAFLDETEFTAKHITVKMAANTAGLGAATALKARRVQVIQERSSDKFDPLGTTNESEYDRLEWEARGELVLRLTNTEYEEHLLSGTTRALSVTLSNGDASLAFTAPKVKTRELSADRSLGDIVTVTLGLYFELDSTTGTTITPVLTNQTANYAAA